MTEVMRAWEYLTDEERLSWRVQGENRRTEGVTYFKMVNLRRLRRGQPLARLPVVAPQCDGRPIIRRLHIRYRNGRLRLWLELHRKPTAPLTVWAALPCNRGLAKPAKCPRLGWLPEAVNGVSHISWLYYEKHGEPLKALGPRIIGKRIFVRVREERDEGILLYEEVSALVPEPS